MRGITAFAKVGVEGSNPFARSRFPMQIRIVSEAAERWPLLFLALGEQAGEPICAASSKFRHLITT